MLRLVVRTVLFALVVLTAWKTFLPRMMFQFYPTWMQIAVLKPESLPTIGSVVWIERGAGLETAEVEVFLDDHLVDMMELVRLSPEHYRFEVHHSASKPRYVEQWLDDLSAAVVVNGSYFLPDGSPQTPIIADGRRLGPAEYRSSHGAFVAGDSPAILDLNGRDTESAIAPYSNVLVSYPLLVDHNHQVRAEGNPNWLASRNFVAITEQGKVLFGATRTGFFSLRRLGNFLAQTKELDISAALNLDGGPLVGQAVRIGDYEHVVTGRSEINDQSLRFHPAADSFHIRRQKLPIVLAAIKK